MASTIREHEKLFSELKDKSKADLPLDSTEKVKWICDREKCRGSAVEVYLRAKYPEIPVCCTRRICSTCGKTGLYNYPELSWGVSCKDCSKEGMVDVIHPKCNFEGKCKTRPTYNLPGEKSGLRCFGHATSTMIDVVGAKCKEKGCNKRPRFNLPEKTTGLYCSLHLKPRMVLVVDVCLDPGCGTTAIYGKPNTLKREYCFTHKPVNYVDVKNKRK